ncbi:follistatin-related protein 5-like isoform X3 [Daphnia pulex]|uniref:follistatin-related protein 5-like isoform X3 n=1 Tax=Daphnia pulex TaxID=6669 RepID=UPI001EDDB976|nr:follistatin-related protein 5-like isoform X3 [Daphnia pulex]
MASGDVARCRNLCAALLLLSAILLVPAESSMKSIEQLVKSRRHRDASSSEYDVEALLRQEITIAVKRDSCSSLFCGRGRECQMNSQGHPECVCVRKCRRHHKLICGTDGILYSSHCELHRSACLSNQPIAIDHTYLCLRRREGNKSSGDSSSSSSSSPISNEDDGVQQQQQHSVKSDRNSWTTATVQSTFSVETSVAGSVDSYSMISTTSETDQAEPHARSSSSSTSQSEPLPIDSFLTPASSSICSQQDYEILKDNLLLYNHARLSSMEDGHSNAGSKDYLVSLMFSHYDLNNNGLLEAQELSKTFEDEHLSQLSKECSLSDMLAYDDVDHDTHLNLNEFYAAFSKLYSVSVVSLDKALELNQVSARVGDNIEIKCDVTGSPTPPIVWRRHGLDLAQLAEDELKVFPDGALYINNVRLIHAGNYTCHAQRNKDVVQTHALHVHTLPEVRVTPRIQSRRPGDDSLMKCHAVGVPFPKVEWLKNDEPLRSSAGERIESIGSYSGLKIHSINFADTGAYMCQASSIGGLARDISSLVVQDDSTPKSSLLSESNKKFFVFHDWGVSVYEPQNCRLLHMIQSTDIMPGTQDYVCGSKGVNCSWGRAIAVADRYIYVTQPNKDRVLVISNIQMVVVDVIMTDRYPVDIFYVEHLDQVWIVNWRDEEDHGVKTIQVIREASQKKKHHTVHPEPIDGHFDLVYSLFIPPMQEYGHRYKYGYVSHTNQRGLYKLSLPAMKYVKAIDLAPYNCVPRSLQYSSLYGLVIMECEEPVTRRPTGQIVMDYLTDTVLSHKVTLLGQPYITPDSRIVVTVHREKTSVTLIVQHTTEDGLKFAFDVRTTLNVSHVIFHPSTTSHSYDLYATSADKGDVLFLNLEAGKVDIITGVGKPLDSHLSEWGAPNRPIASAGLFGTYLISPANEAIFVINGDTRTVNCEIGGLVHPRHVSWINSRP